MSEKFLESEKLKKRALSCIPHQTGTFSRRANSFVEGVFPLILDVEQKAAEKVQECIWEVLFGNIVSFDKAVHTRHFLPWKILNATEKLKMTSYLSRACSQWAKDKMLKPSLLTMLRTHIDTENSNSGIFGNFKCIPGVQRRQEIFLNENLKFAKLEFLYL